MVEKRQHEEPWQGDSSSDLCNCADRRRVNSGHQRDRKCELSIKPNNFRFL